MVLPRNGADASGACGPPCTHSWLTTLALRLSPAWAWWERGWPDCRPCCPLAVDPVWVCVAPLLGGAHNPPPPHRQRAQVGPRPPPRTSLGAVALVANSGHGHTREFPSSSVRAQEVGLPGTRVPAVEATGQEVAEGGSARGSGCWSLAVPGRLSSGSRHASMWLVPSESLCCFCLRVSLYRSVMSLGQQGQVSAHPSPARRKKVWGAGAGPPGAHRRKKRQTVQVSTRTEPSVQHWEM